MTRTISTSALWKTMSNKPSFGRDAEEFLRLAGIKSNISDKGGQGIKITALAPSSDHSVSVRVLIVGNGGRDEKEFVILSEHCEELGLEIGEMDGSLMPEIEYFSLVTKAYFSACASFAYTPSSLNALERKLVLKGFERDVARDAVDAVSSRGFVDENDIALRRAQLMADKLWGRSRIIAKLKNEGFGREAIAYGCDQLDDIDFVESCAALIRKKYREIPSEPYGRNKMLASLSRMGYSASEIKKAIGIVLSDK